MNKKLNFLIQVIDNQNMTWQGNITRLDTQEETQFRSLLELIHLLDSVIDTNKNNNTDNN